VLVPVRSGIEGGDFEQRAEQDGLVDRARPSYVEVLTCLQMDSGTPTTALKPRRRGD
jgi:hypothetical protein